MEKIEVNGEFLFELASKQQWVNRVPQILPDKIRAGETWVWVDKNGNVFECGADFIAAEKHDTYPCKVYRLCNVAGWATKCKKVKKNGVLNSKISSVLQNENTPMSKGLTSLLNNQNLKKNT
jgi:hypothetical protein